MYFIYTFCVIQSMRNFITVNISVLFYFATIAIRTRAYIYNIGTFWPLHEIDFYHD